MVWSKSVSITGEKEDLRFLCLCECRRSLRYGLGRPSFGYEVIGMEALPAYGIVRLATDFTEREIELDLQLPRETRPGAEVVVKVANLSEGDAFVHLWAVDEGVLSVTKFTRPPGQFLLRSLAGEGGFGRPVPRTFQDYRRSSSMERLGRAGSLRRSLVQAKPPKSVILWNEFVPVGKNGLAEGSFLCPMTLQVNCGSWPLRLKEIPLGARKVPCRGLALARRAFVA